MRHLLNNERGYALVIVLLTVIIMFPMMAFLITANTTSARQFRHSEGYRGAIAMAEMGIVRAHAQVAYISDNELNTLLSSASSESEVYMGLVTKIEASFNTLGVVDFDGDSYKLELTKMQLTDEEGIEGLKLLVSSTGTTSMSYTITTTLFISSPNLGDLLNGGSEGSGGGDSDIPDPAEIPDPRDDFPLTSKVATDILTEVQGETGTVVSPEHFNIDNPSTTGSKNFMGESTVAAGTDFIANGSIFGRGWRASNAGSILIRGSFWNDAGGVIMDNVRPIIIEGHFGGSEGYTLSNVDLTVDGDVGIQGGLVFNDSDVKLNGFTGLNSLTVNRTNLRMVDARPSSLSVVDSQVLLTGSLLTEWGGASVTRSTVQLYGHLVGNSQVVLTEGSTFIVNGDANFTAYDPIRFTGTGSRFIVFGDLFSSQGFPWGFAIPLEEVNTLADCPAQVGVNRICIVGEDPTLLTPDTGGDSGSGPGGGGSTIAPDDIIWDMDNLDISYGI